MELSERAIAFIENLNLIDDHSGQQFILRDWQKQIIRSMLKTDDAGNLIVETCFLLLARKNAKTTLIAGLCLFFLTCFPHQQIIGAAGSKDQADRLYEIMVQMVQQDETLARMCEIIPSKSRIVCEATQSFYVSISSTGEVQHGKSPSIVVMDEYHAFTQPKHRRLHAALTTGSGARKNPLTIMISTQTAEKTSLAHEEFEYCRKLKGRMENGKVKRSGQYANKAYFACLYYADEKADWTDRNVWKQVNPALGDFLKEGYLEKKFALAQKIPSRKNVFRQFHLNVPIDSLGKWMNMSLWDQCRGNSPDLTQYKCWGGLDLAPVNDLSAFVLVFDVEGVYHVLPFCWCPESDIMERSKVEQVPYDHWSEQEHIRATHGSSTDFKKVRQDIAEICEKYRVQKIGADRSHAYDVAQGLIEDGYDVEWFRPGFESMGRPTARLEKLVIDGEIVHPGNPVLDYCMSNVVIEKDAAENMKPSNKLRRKQDKIDCATALIIALGMAMWDQGSAEFESVYSSSDCSIWL